MKVFNVDHVTLTSKVMTSYWKINIASEKAINYRATFQSNNCYQISIIVGENLNFDCNRLFLISKAIRCKLPILVYWYGCLLA